MAVVDPVVPLASEVKTIAPPTAVVFGADAVEVFGLVPVTTSV